MAYLNAVKENISAWVLQYKLQISSCKPGLSLHHLSLIFFFQFKCWHIYLQSDYLWFSQCCIHPYILDQTVVPLNKGLSPSEILDVGIKASGKLHLLDKMLSEMKSQHLRVVVFYQVCICLFLLISNLFFLIASLRHWKDCLPSNLASLHVHTK